MLKSAFSVYLALAHHNSYALGTYTVIQKIFRITYAFCFAPFPLSDHSDVMIEFRTGCLGLASSPS